MLFTSRYSYINNTNIHLQMHKQRRKERLQSETSDEISEEILELSQLEKRKEEEEIQLLRERLVSLYKWLLLLLKLNTIFFNVAAKSSAVLCGPRRSGARDAGTESRITAENG